jgi:hypothetical protein
MTGVNPLKIYRYPEGYLYYHYHHHHHHYNYNYYYYYNYDYDYEYRLSAIGNPRIFAKGYKQIYAPNKLLNQQE